MEDRFKNKYRISSSRLQGWDYGSHGLYFVTICAKDRSKYFGNINETQSIASLQVSEISSVAIDSWLHIPQFHPYVELGEFVIMPDHMHGILFINKPAKETWELSKFGPQSKNLASIIRGYKSSVKKYSTLNDIEFSWQPGYYDRVIRNDVEHARIRDYIYDNPQQWMLNKDSFENIFKT
jgi:putative transposase